MKPKIHDIHVAATERLIAPRALKEELPLTEELAQWVANSRQTICRVISGEDPRLMCIVGPCSLHDPDAAVDYAQHLARLAPRVAHRILVVMRVYFEKPRTTIGWKGLINDPLHGRQLRHAAGVANRAPAADRDQLDGPSCRHRGTRSDHAAIYRRFDLLGGHRRAHHRIADPSRDGQRFVDAGGFQESHRRRPENRGQRDRIGARTSFLHRHRPGRPHRDHPHHRQSSNPRGVARRQDAELRRRQYPRMRADANRGQARSARDGGLLARSDQQGLHQTAGGAARADRANRSRQPLDHGCDAGEQYRSRQPETE